MAITLRQLSYFRALVKHGSFSRAAESIYVSQPALSLQIRRLEVLLGGVLVERDNRGIILTQFGREVHQQALRVLDEALFLEAMGKRFQDGAVRVTVGIVSTLAPYLLPGILERLRVPQSRVQIDVVEAPGRELVSALLAGRADAAILSIPLGLMELPERELFEDRFLLAGRAERLAAVRSSCGNKLSPTDLSRADIGPLITLGDGHCLADQVLGACAMWRLEEVRRGAESLSTLARLVASGAGLTLLPETAALSEQKTCPDIHFLRFKEPEPSRQIGLVHRVASHGQRWIDILHEAVADSGNALVDEAQSSISR